QLLRAERGAQSRGHGIRIDVEQHSVVVRGKGAHHRHQPVVEELAHRRRVYLVDVTDEAVVHHLTAGADLHRRALVGTHQAGIDAADPHGLDVEVTADAENARVDETVEDHGGYVDRLLVGDPPALHHAGRHAERRGKLRELRAAAVHENHPHPEIMQDRDLLDEDPGGVDVGEHTAARLHDEGLA